MISIIFYVHFCISQKNQILSIDILLLLSGMNIVDVNSNNYISK